MKCEIKEPQEWKGDQAYCETCEEFHYWTPVKEDENGEE